MIAEAQCVMYPLVLRVHFCCQQEVMQCIVIILVIIVQEATVDEDLQFEVISQKEDNTIVL